MLLNSGNDSKDIVGPFSTENEIMIDNRNDEIWIDNRKIDKAAVRSVIEKMYAENPRGAVVVVADQPDMVLDENGGLKKR